MSSNCAEAGRDARPLTRCLGAALALLLALAGCATERMPAVVRTPEHVLVAPPDAPLAAIAPAMGFKATETGVWPLVQAAFALDARLAMIRNARTSIDVQTYLIGDDSVGRLILRELRDAARRGVRVRLLVDDLYTSDLDRLLLGLAAEPNAEVRLFNPFVTPRDSSFRRLTALITDFKRLNHRMHNKLMLADGAVAVVGGRNLADEYFFRGASGNFIDFDLLMTGAEVGELGGWFDLYWNSPQVYAVGDVVRSVEQHTPPVEALRETFDRVTRDTWSGTRAPSAPTDFFDQPPFSAWLAQKRYHFIAAPSTSFADSPNKIDPESHSTPVDDTLTRRFLDAIGAAREEVLLFSP